MNKRHRPYSILCCLTLGLLLASACSRAPASTATPPPTATVVVPTETPPPTATSVPPTATLEPSATPVPPTATDPPPTATERPTEVPEPQPGDVIFSLADDTCEWSPFGWTMEDGEDTDEYIFEERPDELYLELPEEDTVVYVECLLNLKRDDVQVDVDTTNIAGPNLNNLSVVCRMGAQGWYEAAIDSGGLWYLYRYSNSDGFEIMDQGGSTVINMQKATNHLTLVCAGDDISFYINGVLAGSVTDKRFHDGHVAVSATTFEISGVGTAFTALRVSIPDPANPPGE